MNAMGILPEHAVSGGLASHRLGLEVAGRVVRAGSRIQHVQVGDDVIARFQKELRLPPGLRMRECHNAC